MRGLHYEKWDADRLSGIPGYDSHIVHALVDEDGNILSGIFEHRLGEGLPTKKTGHVIRSCGGWSFNWKDANRAADTEIFTMGFNRAKAMSRKAAAAGEPIAGYVGGAKTVNFPRNMPVQVFTDRKVCKEYLHVFGGELLPRVPHYLTGGDVGLEEWHLDYLSEHTPPPEQVGKCNHNALTAHGVVVGTKALMHMHTYYRNLSEMTFAIQGGAGKVGRCIVAELRRHGVSNIVIADTNKDNIASLVKEHDCIRVVPPEKIHTGYADVFMPCAILGSITEQVAHEMSACMICGCENDPLSTPQVGEILHRRYIAYASHYFINGGGLMTIIGVPVLGMSYEAVTNEMISKIGNRLAIIYRESERTNTPASVVADAMVDVCVAKLSLPE